MVELARFVARDKPRNPNGGELLAAPHAPEIVACSGTPTATNREPERPSTRGSPCRYHPHAVSRSIPHRRVLVSLVLSTVFVGVVVLAGAAFRHHGATHHPTRPPASTATTS
jgi:hypothetical protein